MNKNKKLSTIYALIVWVCSCSAVKSTGELLRGEAKRKKKKYYSIYIGF